MCSAWPMVKAATVCGWPSAACGWTPSTSPRSASKRPGGTLVLQGYTPRQLDYRTGGPPLASHLYTPELLRLAFAGLEIQVLQEYEAELAEGTGHCGHSALIGMVARRP